MMASADQDVTENDDRARLKRLAEWQSGYAAACKAVDAGSIPTSASNPPFRQSPTPAARLPDRPVPPTRPGGEIGRHKGLKIPRLRPCGFESRPGHHFKIDRLNRSPPIAPFPVAHWWRTSPQLLATNAPTASCTKRTSRQPYIVRRRLRHGPRRFARLATDCSRHIAAQLRTRLGDP